MRSKGPKIPPYTAFIRAFDKTAEIELVGIAAYAISLGIHADHFVELGVASESGMVSGLFLQ
jgi:hypothetical protein